MLTRTNDYEACRADAQHWANRTRREMGVEKVTELDGTTVYNVRFLPNPGNRFGWELRCEVVHPVVKPVTRRTSPGWEVEARIAKRPDGTHWSWDEPDPD